MHEVSGCNLTVARVYTKSDQVEIDAIKAELTDLKNILKKLSEYSHGRVKPRRRPLTPSRRTAGKNLEHKRLSKQDLEFYAANGSRISTYGTIKLELDFGLRRSFTKSFLVADVSDPITGAELLKRFELLIDVKHPGVKATQKIIAARFVWKNINKDCALWCRSCIKCEKSEVSRHTKSAVGNFPLPSAHFSHVHIDVVGQFSPVREMTYLSTCVDRFTRWSEEFPIPDQSAETIARAFLLGWISRFSVLEKFTSDRGTNFQSNLFSSLSKILGVQQTQTTTYHPKVPEQPRNFTGF
ncbi:hypothetical protein AVEN_109160-1 [Araneus ventricosus]|uniref:RNA-directed DNA polymerase n=1 Tax=Araneus ventricosus TaxID=182803 RepID=A0A4Y2IW29_ARAVE|nr:hypothetical protein AVEN_109160-1 [Araneus ventricosus]